MDCGLTYKVFNVPDKWLKGQYTRSGTDKNADISCVNTDYNYFYKNGLVFEDKASLVGYVEEKLKEKAKSITFYSSMDITDDFFSESDVPKYISNYMLGEILEANGNCKIIIPNYR